MGSVSPFHRDTINLLGPGPPLGRLENNHRPLRSFRDAPFSGVRLNSANLGDHLVKRRGHPPVHRLWFVPLDEVRSVTVTSQEVLELIAADTQDRRVGDFVAVQMEDGQNGASVAGLRNLFECQLVARGPVSASPSPTTHATIRSGLSKAAPKEWLKL